MGFFENPCVAIITGSNRGYGQAIAETFLDLAPAGSMLILHSRTGEINWIKKKYKNGIKLKIINGDLRDPKLNWKENFMSENEGFSEALLFGKT